MGDVTVPELRKFVNSGDGEYHCLSHCAFQRERSGMTAMPVTNKSIAPKRSPADELVFATPSQWSERLNGIVAAGNGRQPPYGPI